MSVQVASLFDKPVVFLDTETTSLDPHNRLPWDVGMVKVFEDGTVKTQQFFIELTERQIANGNTESLEIGGFDERYNGLEAYSPATAARIIRDFTSRAYLAGINIHFDEVTLDNLMHPVGVRPEWDYSLFDVRTYLFGRYNVDRWKVSQSELQLMTGVELDTAKQHSALYDAQFAYDQLHAALSQ